MLGELPSCIVTPKLVATHGRHLCMPFASLFSCLFCQAASKVWKTKSARPLKTKPLACLVFCFCATARLKHCNIMWLVGANAASEGHDEQAPFEGNATASSEPQALGGSAIYRAKVLDNLAKSSYSLFSCLVPWFNVSWYATPANLSQLHARFHWGKCFGNESIAMSLT